MQKKKPSNLKRYMHPNVHSSTIYSSQDIEAIQMSIDRGMDKEDVIHLYKGILSSVQLLSHVRLFVIP